MALVVEATDLELGGYVNSAIEKVKSGGWDKQLDIVLVNCPKTLRDTEQVVRTVYGYTLHSDLNCTVYPHMVKRDWPFVFSNIKSGLPITSPTPIEPVPHKKLVAAPTPSSSAGLHELNFVAVGGTFDHLHAGHKLLLCAVGLWSNHKVLVGITGPKLLVNKKYAEQLESYETREARVKEYFQNVFPMLEVECHQINDVYGPTATIEALDGLVVSRETAKGGSAVNELREGKSWPALKVFEIGLIPSLNDEEKLSSTYYRQKEAQPTS